MTERTIILRMEEDIWLIVAKHLRKYDIYTSIYKDQVAFCLQNSSNKQIYKVKRTAWSPAKAKRRWIVRVFNLHHWRKKKKEGKKKRVCMLYREFKSLLVLNIMVTANHFLCPKRSTTTWSISYQSLSHHYCKNITMFLDSYCIISFGKTWQGLSIFCFFFLFF